MKLKASKYDSTSQILFFSPNEERSSSKLAGLLAADFLKRDIDSFTYKELLETQKKIPMKEMISLNERYPFQFYRQFQKTGRIDFETRLIDFDRRYLGGYQQEIKPL